MTSSEVLLSRRTLSKNVVWSVVGQVAPAIVGIVATPLIIRGLGDERFGLLTLVWMLIGYLSLFDLGLGRAVTKLTAERLIGPARSELRQFVWTAWFLMAALGLLGGVLPALWADQIVTRGIKTSVEVHAEALMSLRILLLSVPALVLMNGFRGVLEAGQRFGLVNAVRIPFGLSTFLIPLGVLQFTHSLPVVVAGLAVARLVATIAYAFMCIAVLGADARPTRPNRSSARQLISFGAWLTVSNIIGSVIATFDRFAVGALISVAMVTYYATPFQIGMQFLIVPGAVAAVLFPAFATAYTHDEPRVTQLFVNGLKVVFALLYPLVVCFITFAPEILRVWIGGKFPELSATPMRCILAGIMLNGLAQLPFALIQSTGRSDVTGKIHIAELVPYLAALLFVGRRYGINAIAFVWFVRAMLDFLILMWFARKLGRIHLPSPSPLLAAGLALFPLTLVFFVPSVLGRVILLFVFSVPFVWRVWQKGLNDAQRASVRSFVSPSR